MTEVEQVWAPQWRAGQVVVLDKLRAHKGAGVQAASAARGARVQYLPPYSPDCSPLEPCWSQLTTCLRATAARTRGGLDQALTAGLKLITPPAARGWFRHCGYCPTPN